MDQRDYGDESDPLAPEQRARYEEWKRAQEDDYARRRFAWRLTEFDRSFLAKLRISATD